MKSRRRYTLIFFLILLGTLLQSTILHHFRIFGTIPDLVMLFIIMLGLYNGVAEGVVFGMLAGLVLGYFSSGYCGIFCFSYGTAGLAAGFVSERMHPDDVVMPLLAATVLTAACSFLVVVLNLALGSPGHFHTFLMRILPLLLMNALLAIPMGYLARARGITSRRPIEYIGGA